MTSRVAIDAVKEEIHETGEVITLQSGYKAKYVSVAPALLQVVNQKIKNPPIPVFHDKDKDRDVENPTDPKYLAEVREINNARTEAMIDIMVLMGVEMVDPVPSDEKWLSKLKYLEKKGHLDLKEFDLSDPMEREYVFKRFVAVGVNDLKAIMKLIGLNEEEVRRASDSFQREGKR